MFSLDERVDCAWLQSGLTGHRGTDRMEGRGGRKATVQNLMRGAVKTRGSSKNTLQPILSSDHTVHVDNY